MTPIPSCEFWASGPGVAMMGTAEVPGIIPRAIRHIFDRIEQSDAGTSYQMRASFVEIYNETIKDLLCPSNGLLDVREGPEGTSVAGGRPRV